MPLRDHFHAPLDNFRSWEMLHGQWPAMLVIALSRKLPPGYVAGPQVHLGGYFEIDVAAFDEHERAAAGAGLEVEGGGVATAVWAPPEPSLAVETELSGQDEYEVRIYDTKRHQRLVAAVEFVSPANKDRPENRRLFVAKCAALLRQHVCVVIVDVVTIRQFNLYFDLLDLLGETDPSLSPRPPLYGAACRFRRDGDVTRLETWSHAFAVGHSLPTLPLWLADNLAVPLELETTYEETCRVLRID